MNFFRGLSCIWLNCSCYSFFCFLMLNNSMFISNTATASVMVPIVVELLLQLKNSRHTDDEGVIQLNMGEGEYAQEMVDISESSETTDGREIIEERNKTKAEAEMGSELQVEEVTIQEVEGDVEEESESPFDEEFKMYSVCSIAFVQFHFLFGTPFPLVPPRQLPTSVILRISAENVTRFCLRRKAFYLELLILRALVDL